MQPDVLHSTAELLNQRLRRSLLVPFLGLVFLIIALTVLIFYYADEARWVSHSSEAISVTNLIQRIMVDSESGIRGYEITSREEFLQSFKQAQADLPATLERLRKLAAGYKDELKEVDVIEAGYKKWLDFATRDLIRIDENKLAELKKNETGKVLMDQVRSSIQAFIAAERKLKVEREDAAKVTFRFLIISVIGLAFSIVIYLSFFTRKVISQVSNAFAETVANQRQIISERDDFLSIASHELKTPLTSLKLQAQLLRRSIDKGDSSAYSKERIDLMCEQTERQVLRLIRLVDDMLDISRIRSGKLTLEPENFDLCALVQESIQNMTSQFKAAGCGVPEYKVCDPTPGRWDRMRIEQVVNNLFTNAIRYGRGNAIEVKVEHKGKVALLSVKDRGIGIPKHMREAIFNKFERAVSTGEIAGLGLGLYIAKQIVETHRGRIWVDSEIDKGSTFFVELPIYEV